MLSVHKVTLAPNNKQKTYFKKAAGIARFSYNWALSKWIEQYKNGEKPSEISLRRELNKIKKTEFPWMLEVTKVAPQQAIKNLGNAFTRFFKKQGAYPRFKKKGINVSFRTDNGPPTKGVDAINIIGKKIKIPKLGWLKMQEELRFKGLIKSVTISRTANRWYAAINVDTSNLPHIRKNHASVGVDLGIKALATLSNGQQYVGPKAHTTLLKKLKRVSRSLSKKVKGSQNHRKQKEKLAKLHAKITNIRKDSLHKLTTDLVLNYTKIGIENLNVKGMLANRKLSRHIMDQSFYEFRRQLEYKSFWYASELIVIDRFFPSSKMCNACGAINKNLKLQDREWVCSCGKKHDRDINAALNIEQQMYTVSSTEIYACGTEGSGKIDMCPLVKPCSVEAGT